jgi:hypothetical protein
MNDREYIVVLAFRMPDSLKHKPYNVGNLMVIILFINTNNIGWNISTFGWSSDDNFLGTSLNPSTRTIYKNSCSLLNSVR